MEISYIPPLEYDYKNIVKEAYKCVQDLRDEVFK